MDYIKEMRLQSGHIITEEEQMPEDQPQGLQYDDGMKEFQQARQILLQNIRGVQNYVLSMERAFQKGDKKTHGSPTQASLELRKLMPVLNKFNAWADVDN